MAGEAIRQLEEQLNCSICLDTYNDPKMLPHLLQEMSGESCCQRPEGRSLVQSVIRPHQFQPME